MSHLQMEEICDGGGENMGVGGWGYRLAVAVYLVVAGSSPAA